MSESYLIAGARPAGGDATRLYVRDGRFADPDDAPDDTRVIDADGLIALPGLVDLHAHLREPGGEQAGTISGGAQIAAAGGYTAVFAMADTDPCCDTGEAAAHVRQLGADAACEIVPVGAVTRSRAGTELAELGLMRSFAGVTMFSDCDHSIADAQIVRRALEYVSGFGGVVAEHAQDPRLAGPNACCHEGEYSGRLGLPAWPAVAESAVIARDVQIAAHTGGRLHIHHVSTAESVEVLRWAKAKGIAVTAEVAPHHLLLDVSELESYDPVFKVNPPLRSADDVRTLREALADGTIDAVASDHSPVEPQDKDHPFDVARAGMLGLGQALAVVVETMLDSLGWDGIADRMSIAPARIGGIDATQGRTLAVGEPATFVLVDPVRRSVVASAGLGEPASNNPYVGRELPDPVALTAWNGAITFSR